MKPRAVELRGEIVGNGFPGALWSPDLVLRDETGMIFLLYRSSIPFGRVAFGMTADRFIGEQVRVTGWFRRGLRPYVELSTMEADLIVQPADRGPISYFSAANLQASTERETVTQRTYSRWIQGACAAVATAAGVVMLLT